MGQKFIWNKSWKFPKFREILNLQIQEAQETSRKKKHNKTKNNEHQTYTRNRKTA